MNPGRHADSLDNCCCGPAAKDDIVYRPVPVVGAVALPAGDIPVISSEWRAGDWLGMAAARCGWERMEYAVAPGLYAAGRPDENSPVIVTANYKLSFDVVRRALNGLNVWILVIDTKGVNVWCAAGKGTFGTEEIVNRIALTGLGRIVSHRSIIVPQLGAPGVAAHRVKELSGFTVFYGPVRARDIARYLQADMQADHAMRRVRFGLRDRLAVAWLELFMALKPALALSVLIFVALGIAGGGFSLSAAMRRAGVFIASLLAGVFTGTVLTAVFLPFIPGRSFAWKGGLLGLVVAAGLAGLNAAYSPMDISFPGLTGAALFISSISAYLALNYTGCSTYTSLSGVQKEIRYALPAIIGMFVTAAFLQIIGAAL